MPISNYDFMTTAAHPLFQISPIHEDRSLSPYYSEELKKTLELA